MIYSRRLNGIDPHDVPAALRALLRQLNIVQEESAQALAALKKRVEQLEEGQHGV